MAAHREVPALLVALLLTLAGCAEQTAKTAEAPSSPAPPPRPDATPAPQTTPPPAPAPTPAIVSPAPPPAPAPASPPRTEPQEFVEEPALKDVFFDPGHTEIGHHGSVIMKANAGWLIEHAATVVLVEGHTDWKGTPEANMAVGERRARAARDFLVKAGVGEARIQIVSYGSDRPVCPQKTEACAARNRRVHFLVKSQ